MDYEFCILMFITALLALQGCTQKGDTTDEAVSTQDITICDRLSDECDRADCYMFVVSSKRNSTLCEKITAQDTLNISCRYTREDCYTDLSIRYNLSLCDKIDDTTRFSDQIDISQKDMCYLGQLSDTNDPGLCEKINNSAAANTCYQNIALKTHNSSLCSKVSPGYWQHWCYTACALEEEDESICGSIEPGDDKNNCYLNAAIKKKDPFICEHIDWTNARDYCKAKAGPDNSSSD